MNKNKFAKLLLIFVFMLAGFNLFGLSVDSLKPSGWVNDYAGIIDSASNVKINAIITELEQKTGAEIAVVTIKSLEGNSLEDFTNRLFSKWGIGKKGKDNGLMILVAMDERKIRIETGYGIEGMIPDGAAGSIIRDYMTPEFRQGNPGQAINAGVYYCASIIAKNYNVELSGNYSQRRDSSSRQVSPFQKVLSAIFMIIMLIIFIKNPWLFLLILTSSGRGGGGGFGGGFGGFGGGSSGGGGASGGW